MTKNTIRYTSLTLNILICHQKLVTLHAERDIYPDWTVLPLIDGKNTRTARSISIPYGWRNTKEKSQNDGGSSN